MANATTKRIIALLDSEIQEILGPKAVDPEARYITIKEIFAFCMKDTRGYGLKDFSLGDEGRVYVEEIQHYLKLLDALYAPKAG